MASGQKNQNHNRIYPDLDEIIKLIEEGWTYRAMAAHYSIPLSTLFDFLNRPEHSARVRLARLTSADAIAEKAEEALLNAPSNLPEIARARELAQYYKWYAAIRNRNVYSEKHQLDITQTTKTIKVNVPGEEQDEESSTDTDTDTTES